MPEKWPLLDISKEFLACTIFFVMPSSQFKFFDNGKTQKVRDTLSLTKT